MNLFLQGVPEHIDIDKVNKARLGDTTIDYEETAQSFRSDSWKYLVGI